MPSITTLGLAAVGLWIFSSHTPQTTSATTRHRSLRQQYTAYSWLLQALKQTFISMGAIAFLSPTFSLPLLSPSLPCHTCVLLKWPLLAISALQHSESDCVSVIEKHNNRFLCKVGLVLSTTQCKIGRRKPLWQKLAWFIWSFQYYISLWWTDRQTSTQQQNTMLAQHTDRDFTEARDGEWQWNLLGHMQVCTSLQTDNHASTPLLSFLLARCPSCRPTNSVKALKAIALKKTAQQKNLVKISFQ